jgi:hypothetical protein
MRIKLAYSPRLNEYQGRKSVQLVMSHYSL